MKLIPRSGEIIKLTPHAGTASGSVIVRAVIAVDFIPLSWMVSTTVQFDIT